jgi:RNA polymerase primary sigma factor
VAPTTTPARRRLTPSEERDLVLGADAGDTDASRRLVEAFLPAIVGLANGFPGRVRVEQRELVQDGVAGLLLAARRYDPGRRTPFWAYASFWVRKAMQELVAELARPFALSDRAVRDLARVRAARREYLQAHGHEATEEELSRATGLSRAQLESLQAAERAPAATVEEGVVDPAAEQAYELVLDEIEIHELQGLADRLDERERSVLNAHYGLGRPVQTLNEIGGELGLTAERARQIEVAALEKLREAL